LPTSLIYSCHSKALNPKLASCLWKGDLGSMKELIWFSKLKKKEKGEVSFQDWFSHG